MTSVWGRCPELPVRLLDGVHAHALALGRVFASDDLFLLAIACLDEARPARRALAAEGIDSRRLMSQREVEWGPRVWFDRADVRAVVDHLRAHIAPGTRWGFNYEGAGAWAIAEAAVDLDALVSAALAR
jgi:hypothetical protein